VSADRLTADRLAGLLTSLGYEPPESTVPSQYLGASQPPVEAERSTATDIMDITDITDWTPDGSMSEAVSPWGDSPPAFRPPSVVGAAVLNATVIGVIVADPVVVDPTVADPAVADPAVVDPVVVDPVVVDLTVHDLAVPAASVRDATLVDGTLVRANVVDTPVAATAFDEAVVVPEVAPDLGAEADLTLSEIVPAAPTRVVPKIGRHRPPRPPLLSIRAFSFTGQRLALLTSATILVVVCAFLVLT
jgi:hypothetical protein